MIYAKINNQFFIEGFYTESEVETRNIGDFSSMKFNNYNWSSYYPFETVIEAKITTALRRNEELKKNKDNFNSCTIKKTEKYLKSKENLYPEYFI